MAGKTEILLFCSETLVMVGSVGKMAAKAPITGNSTMLGLGTVQLLNKFLVTITAQRGPVILEVKSILGTVGSMTILTGFLYRRVHILELKFLFFIFVAAETEGQAVHG